MTSFSRKSSSSRQHKERLRSKSSPQLSSSEHDFADRSRLVSDGDETAIRDLEFDQPLEAITPSRVRRQPLDSLEHDDRDFSAVNQLERGQSLIDVRREQDQRIDRIRRASFSSDRPQSAAVDVSSRVDILLGLVDRPTRSQFLTTVLAAPIDISRSTRIPQQIHRFWSGGKLSDAAMQVLRESAGKTQGTAWSHTLWYSRSIEEEIDKEDPNGTIISLRDRATRDTQRMELLDLAYKVKPIEDLALPDSTPPSSLVSFFLSFLEKSPPPPPSDGFSQKDFKMMAKKAVFQLKSDRRDKWDGIKHFSDIARLIYLQQVGGHHFDVDMGLGDMDFTRDYFHNDEDGQVPLFGAVTATSDDSISRQLEVIAATEEIDFQSYEQRDAAIQFATRASEMAAMLNGMIATAPRNPRFADALAQLKVDAISQIGEIPSGMIVTPKLLYSAEEALMTEDERKRIRGLAVPVYVLDLQHITAESDSR